MSHYVSIREEQRQARTNFNYKRVGLPANERHDLDRAQRRSDLAHHFDRQGDKSRAYKPSRTAYQDAGLSHDQRQKISDIRTATRAALGSSFDPFDEATHIPSRRRDHNYGRSRGWTVDAAPLASSFVASDETIHRPSRRFDDDNVRSRGWTGDVAPPRTAIPSQYLKEFNQSWHEDDEDRDADQYLADHAPNAPWRNHVELEPRTHYRGERSTHQRRPRTAASASTGVKHGVYDARHLQPNQPSAFDWAESVHEKPKRRFRNLFRRHH
jgi:hypothetical protein